MLSVTAAKRLASEAEEMTMTLFAQPGHLSGQVRPGPAGAEQHPLAQGGVLKIQTRDWNSPLVAMTRPSIGRTCRPGPDLVRAQRHS